jgi:hypothetical protein
LVLPLLFQVQQRLRHASDGTNTAAKGRAKDFVRQ